MPTLYVTDLDGTLLDEEGRVPEDSARILNGLIARGMLFTVATARTPATVVDLLAGVDLRLPAVLMTGTLLYDVRQKKAMAATPFSPHALDALCTLLDATGQEALLYCARGDHLTAYYRQLTGRFERAFVASRQGSPYKTFTQVPRFSKAARGAQALVVLLCLDSAADASRWYKALSQLDDVTCYCYADEYGRGYTVEAYPAGCDKATGLAQVKRLCGADRVVAFGDSVNDLPLFAASDEACAVAGACPEAKRAADRVIGANSENGVARWLQENFIPQEEGAPCAARP